MKKRKTNTKVFTSNIEIIILLILFSVFFFVLFMILFKSFSIITKADEPHTIEVDVEPMVQLSAKNTAEEVMVGIEEESNPKVEVETEELEKVEEVEEEVKDNVEVEEETEVKEEDEFYWDGPVLNSYVGTVMGPSGKETYYNLPMGGVIDIMRNMGFSEEEYPYWEREDGCKMLGDYIMVAANLDLRPRGSLVDCSLGRALVCDTGGFASSNPEQLDVAVNW